MLRILDGVKTFSKKVYPEKKALFDSLAKGQNPHTLIVICSDSRIDPHLMTQTNPGDIFVLRNAGNLVPVYGQSTGGEESAVEFAVSVLGVSSIVVCGHSNCGAMAGLMTGVNSEELPAVAAWLLYAKSTKERVASIENPSLCTFIHENALQQVENLKTHPSVKKAVEEDKLHLFAAVYEFEKGKVSFYNRERKEYVEASKVSEEGKKTLDEFSL